MKNEPQINNKIIVGNLVKKLSCEDLRKIFKEYGEILIDLKKGQDINSAEITFKTVESAKQALAKNNTMLKYSQIKVHLIQDESEMSDNEGYDAFMNEYKQFYRENKKMVRTRVEEIGLNEVNLSEMLSQANNLYLSNQHDEAIGILHEIIKQNPEIQEPYQILSQIYEERNDIKNALSFLMLAAQLSNGDKDIWIRCCHLNKQIKNFQQAEYCITRALKLEKKNIYILFERGSLNEEIGNLAKATRIYETLINYYPNLEILLYTIKIHEKLNRPDKAVNLLEKNYSRVQKKVQAMLALYDLYLKYKYYERGVQTYNSIKNKKDYNVLISNDNFQIKRLICFLYVKEMKSDDGNTNELQFLDRSNLSEDVIGEILKHFSGIINSITSNELYIVETEIDNLLHLFYLLDSVNQISKFITIFSQIEKMLDTAPIEIKQCFYQLNPEIYAKISDHFFISNDYNQAILFFSKCLDIINDDLIRVKLSEAYSFIGQNEKALEVLNKKTELKEGSTALIDQQQQQLRQDTNKNNPNAAIDIDNEVSLSEYEDEKGEGLYTFIKHQINGNYDDEEEEEEDNNNNNIYAELMTNDIFTHTHTHGESSFMPKTYEPPNYLSTEHNNQSKVFTGRKRLRTTAKKKQSKDKLIIDYNFDNYLHRKIRSKTKHNDNDNTLKHAHSTSTMNSFKQNLNSLKIDFEELKLEVTSHKPLYLKLQESLLILQLNNIDKFISNTFEPLKQVLIQELKIEDYKNNLFNYILDKSLIKNYFHKKTSVFDQNDDNIEEEEEVNFIEALKPITDNNNQIEDKFADNQNEFSEKKENLFVRKTANKYLLAKKKIGKTLTLVENQLNDLDNIEKYFQPESFFKIIEKFIEYSYQKEHFKDVYVIITLLVNSRYFLQRNDYLSFNILLYAIMTSFKLKRYKICFELLKRNISKYSLHNISIFWMEFWNVGRHLTTKISRNYLYKFSLKKMIGDNALFQQILATCYYHNGNLELTHQLFGNLIQKNKSPYLLLLISLSYLFQTLSRSINNKKPNYLKALHFFNLYTINRIKSRPYEVAYNLGRLSQFIGNDRKALNKYNEMIHLVNNSIYWETDKIKQSCIYNMSLIYSKQGQEEKAHQVIMDNIII